MATYYAVATGNWNGSTVWSLTTGGITQPLSPGSGDTANFDSGTGSAVVTLTGASAAATLNMTGNTGTLAFGAQTLTITAGATLQGAMTSTSGKIVVQGGGVTLAGTPTGTFPLLNFTTAGGTLTSRGFTWPGATTFSFSTGTYTFNGNWINTGLTTISVATVFNKTTSETYTANGGLTVNAALTGTLAGINIGGGTWSAGGSIADSIAFPVTFTGNVTVSGRVTMAGASNSINWSSGTITTSGSTLAISSVTVAFSVNTGTNVTWNNFFNYDTSVTVTLPSVFTITGIFSVYGSNVTFSGISTLNCANFSFNGSVSDSYQQTWPAGVNINISNSLTLFGGMLYTGAVSIPAIESGTPGSSIFLNYTGTPNNAILSTASFTDVDASGSNFKLLNYTSPSLSSTLLTRTKNIINITPSNIGGIMLC